MVIEPLERVVESAERFGSDASVRAIIGVSSDDVAETISIDEFDNLREAVGVNLRDDLSAVDFGGRGGNGKAIGLLVVHHLDDVFGRAVHLEFAGLPFEGGSGFLIATLVGVIGKAFVGPSLDVVALVVAESAIGNLGDFDDLRVVNAELNLSVAVREKRRAGIHLIDLVPRLGGVLGNQSDAVC